MSLSKSKCWYSNNCLHLLKCTVPLQFFTQSKKANKTASNKISDFNMRIRSVLKYYLRQYIVLYERTRSKRYLTLCCLTHKVGHIWYLVQHIKLNEINTEEIRKKQSTGCKDMI